MARPSYNTSIITAVGKTQQNLAAPQFVIGGKGGSGGTTYQLFKKSTAYTYAVWMSEKFKIGREFQVKLIRIPLAAAVATNMAIIPVLQFDDASAESIGTAINPTKYPDGNRVITLTEDNFSFVTGKNNFFLELRHEGSVLLPVAFPITIEVETIETED